MNSNHFQSFLTKLLTNPSKDTVISIKGVKKYLSALAHLTTDQCIKDGATYYKMLFTDGSFILALPDEEEIYYADKLLHHILEIPDKDIGTVKEISYDNRLYRLGNCPSDYQFMLELIVGTPYDIEREARFSDYFPVIGPKAFLSLGWLMRTGERADILCNIIDNNLVAIL